MKTIAILDGQTIQTIAVTKRLKESGFKVVLLYDSKFSYGYGTRYADKKILMPSTKNETLNFHKVLLEILQDEKIDVLIPMNDYSARYLSFYKIELLKYTSFIVPDYEIFMKGYDKNQLMKICAENDFPHPKTVDLGTVSENDILNSIEFPAIIKPNTSTGARGFTLVHSVDEVQKKLPEVTRLHGDCHLQEFVPPGGEQFKVQLFVHDKNLVNYSVIHKIRFYPINGGSSCFNQTIESMDLVKLCYNVLEKIGWQGFADFDLIQDPRDNKIKILEINPRIPACIRASFSAGIDFTENIVSSSLGFKPQAYEYQPGSYLRYLGLDILWFLISKNRFKAKPFWLNSVFSSRHYLQDCSIRDLKPFVYGTLGGVLKQADPEFRTQKKQMNCKSKVSPKFTWQHMEYERTKTLVSGENKEFSC